MLRQKEVLDRDETRMVFNVKTTTTTTTRPELENLKHTGQVGFPKAIARPRSILAQIGDHKIPPTRCPDHHCVIDPHIFHAKNDQRSTQLEYNT